MIGRFKCETCKNFTEGDLNPRTWKCKAFPNGIPEIKIAFITQDPCTDCNNGIGYKPKEKEND